jgi:hypothetical protein
MKKVRASLGALLITVFSFTVLLCTGCIREVIYTEDGRYTPFPEAEILGASFYYQLNGRDVTGDAAGMISKNEDGTYTVKMKRRSPSTSPSAMFITGPFEFSDFYKIVCTFPEDPAINKPYRIYACASVYMDGNDAADYPTAVDLVGDAVFRNGVAIGTFEMTNEGINYLNPDPSGRGRPYITVFLYLYFQNVGDPEEYYEFTLDFVGGANGYVPASVVTKAEVYRVGDMENKFMLETVETDEVELDVETGEYRKKVIPILARFDHRYDSQRVNPAIPVLSSTSALYIDLQVPSTDAEKQIQFEVRNAGLYSLGSTINLIDRAMNMGARVEGGQVQIEEITVSGNPITYRYKIRATTRRYDSNFTGVRLAIPGTAGTFVDIGRFSCVLHLPEEYGWTD